jgi:hypothetical protein
MKFLKDHWVIIICSILVAFIIGLVLFESLKSVCPVEKTAEAIIIDNPCPEVDMGPASPEGAVVK